MSVVWVPWEQVREGVGEIPGLRVEVHDPQGDLPPWADEVVVYVPPFLASGRPVELIRELPRLELVQLLTAGADTIIPHVPEGVSLCTARGAHDAGTAEWAVAAMLASQRELPRFVRSQVEHHWDFAFTRSLADKRVLIVGYGSIGGAIERRLAGFEVEVIRVARSARDGVHGLDELPALLPEADVVVLIVPLTSQTRGMVDKDFLAAMKDGALLVNAARGPVVDTDALLAELTSERLRAALDVTDPEPLPADHPLWQAPGLLLTPHVAGSNEASVNRVFGVVRRQLQRFAAGEPLEGLVHGEY
jgi:phosphoglycerate dehydrogenase-like enzyme